MTEDECNSIDTTDKLFDKLKEKGHLNLSFSSCGILRGLIDAVKRYSDTIEIDEFTERVNVEQRELAALGKYANK